MAGYNIGPKIGIDGEAEFRQQITRLNASYKTLTAETKAVTAAFDANGDEQGKLRATSQQLEKQLDNQRKRADLLSDAVKKASDEYGKNSTKAQRLQAALYDTQATITGLEQDLSKTNDELERAGDNTGDFADEAEDAGDMVEDLADNLDGAGASALDFGDVLKANLLSDAIMSGLQKLGSLVKDFGSGMIEAAASVQAESAQFSQTFGNLEKQAKSSLQSISDETNIAATRMQGSFTQIYAFAKTSGAESAEALDIASRAMEAAADSAAYYDRSIEDVTETLQSFLKGNYANDAALGIAATETTRNTKANELYAKSFQELSESQKVDVLLSMVEAGNKASGAIGQAARESESWENVTGELSESWRQLQAVAGAPVLKQTIPVIEKITDKLKDAADSGKFEALAEGIGNSLGWLIDNGPEVISVAGGIAAGIAAFKVATTAAKGLDTLNTSLSAMHTILTGHPIAIAAAAVVGLATAIGGMIASADSAVPSIEELTTAASALGETITQAQADYDASIASATGAAEAARSYTDRLAELEAQGLETGAAQAEYRMTVDALNQLMPELNLVIDEQTGLVRDGTDAIYDHIDALKEQAVQQAMQAQYEDVVSAWADATAELYTNQAKLSQAEQEADNIKASLIENQRKQKDLMDKIMSVQNDTNLSFEEANQITLQYDQQLNDLRLEAGNLEMQLKDNADVQDAYNSAIDDCKAKLAENQGAVDEQTDAWKAYQESLGNTDGQGVQIDANDRLIVSLSAMRKEYEKLSDEANQSIKQQIGLFEDLSGAADQTFEDMLAALESQATAFSNYADNIATAMERGIDQGLVEQLSDGSAESMQILQVLVNGTDEQIADLNTSLGRVEEGRRLAANAMAGMQSDFDDVMREMQESGIKYGRYMVEGVVRGIEENIQKLEGAMHNLGRRGAAAFRNEMTIASPSGVMEDIAKWIPAGAAQGVDGAAEVFIQSMRDLARAGADEFAGLAADSKANAEGLLRSELMSIGTPDMLQKVGIFDFITGTSDKTFADMLAALDSQATVFSDYADNLILAMERGIDRGLVEQLSDGSLESMRILQVLVSGTDDEISQLNKALGRVEDGRRTASKVISGLQDDFDTALEDMTRNAYSSGASIASRLSEGIKDSIKDVEASMRSLAQRGAAALNFEQSVRDVTASGSGPLSYYRLGFDADGIADSLYTPINDRESNGGVMRHTQVNLGGVSISLAAPAGTDLETLARMVGDAINEEAIRLAVAYG